jgi:PAS domain S-box-containing protein
MKGSTMEALPRRPLKWPYVITAALVVLLINGFTLSEFLQRRHDDQFRAELDAQNNLQLLDHSVHEILTQVDIVLLAITQFHLAEVHDNPAKAAQVNDYLKKISPLIPELVSLRIMNQTGTVIAGINGATALGVDRSFRDYFQRARDKPAPELIVSGPLLGAISRQKVIVLARRLTVRDGSFVGVVSASIETRKFTGLLAKLNLKPGRTAALFNKDFSLVHEYPESAPPLSDALTAQRLGANLISPTERGVFVSRNGKGDIEQTHYFRKLQDFPFHAVVSESNAENLVSRNRTLITFFSLASLASILAVVAIMIAWRKSAQHTADLRGQTRGRLALQQEIAFREEAQLELERALLRQKRVFDSLFEGVVLHDKDAKIIICNYMAPKLLGLTEDQLMGRTSLDPRWKTVHPNLNDFPGEQHPAVVALTTGKDVLGVVMGVYWPDQSLHWLSINAKPLFNDDGEHPDGVVVSFMDVTEQRLHTQTISISQKRLTNIVDSAYDAIITTDQAQRIIVFNLAAESMFGYAAADVLGQKIDMLIPEKYRVKHDAHMRNAQAIHGKPARAMVGDRIIQGVRSNGEEFPVEASISVIRSEGELTYTVVVRDISLRIKADIELRKLSMVVEQSPEIVIVMNPKWQIEYVNEAFVQITGFSREESIGRNPRDLLGTGKTPADRFVTMTACLYQRKPWKGQIFNFHKDGSEHIHFAIVNAIHQDDGSLVNYVSVQEDITERTRLNEELDRYRNHLESLVSSRTEELNNARNEAEIANAAKSQFLANMSHEIRTPLNSVLGMAQLALRAAPSPQQKDYLDKIFHSGMHLLGVISDILDFSKIEAAKLDIELSQFNLPDCIRSVEQIIVQAHKSSNVAMSTEIAAEVPRFVWGDSLRLSQVLINFANNAFKFTKQGEVRIMVHLIEGDENGALLRFSVRDTGIGIPPHSLHKLFSPFQQVDVSTTRQYGGTGLGLAISKRLVELMGGEIHIQSEVGEGSTFGFDLYMKVAQAATHGIPAKQVPLSILHGKHILVVEDTPFNQQVAEEMLTDVGVIVSIAHHGKQALELIEETMFDLVLMDIQMPGMSGYETTQQVRRAKRYDRLPIIAMTANATRADRDAAKAAGMNDFIAKPVLAQQLYAVIARNLPQTSDPEQTATSAMPHCDPAASASIPDSLATLAPPSSIDLKILRGMIGSDIARISHFANLAMESIVQGLAQMQIELERGQRGEYAEIAHRLKSAALTLGANHLGGLFNAASDLAATDSDEQAFIWLEQLQASFAPLPDILERQLAGLAHTP